MIILDTEDISEQHLRKESHNESHEHKQHEHNQHHNSSNKNENIVHESKNLHIKEGVFSRENLLFLSIVVIILVATVYLRLSLIQYQGFYEPDGFYHFSVIRAAVNNNFVVPKTLVLSGWPGHTLVTEPVGLYWVTLFPYFILQFFNVSYYDVMRLIPLLFAIFDVLGAYYLSRFISKDKIFGVLVMTLVALSAGDAARTSALIYRGDGFITIFLLLALIFIAYIFKTKDRDKKIAFMLLGALSLSICNAVWNGASFANAIVIMSFVVIMIVAFIFKKYTLYNDTGYLIGMLALWFVLVNLYRYATFFYSQALTAGYFLDFFALIIIGWIIGYVINNKEIPFLKIKINTQILDSVYVRALVVIVFAAITSVIIIVFMGAFITQVFVNNGFITQQNIFAQTIQELTPPTYTFLFASFGITLIAKTSTVKIIVINTPTITPFFFSLLEMIFAINITPNNAITASITPKTTPKLPKNV